MEINFVMTGIGISYGVNFTLLYTRKQQWNSDQFRWIVTGLLFIVGLLGLLGESDNKDFQIFSWCLLTPIIYNGSDRLFKKISESKNNRDFYLWLRGSFEIDDSMNGRNPHVGTLDIVISMVLLFEIGFLPLLWAF